MCSAREYWIRDCLQVVKARSTRSQRAERYPSADHAIPIIAPQLCDVGYTAIRPKKSYRRADMCQHSLRDSDADSGRF